MRALHLPWLELAIVVPLLGAWLLGAWLLGLAADRPAIRRGAIGASLLTLGLTVGAWLDFGTLGTFAAQDRGSLVRWLLGRELFQVDELNAPLLPMAAILVVWTILATTRSKAERFSYRLTLVAAGVLVATLSCTVPLALIVLLFVGTIPPWLELRRRRAVTRVFELYQGVHLGLLLLGTGVLGLAADSIWMANLGGGLLVLSSLIRAGIFPAHSWVVDLFERATFGTALLYIVPMTGAYLVMRSVWPVVPVWALRGVAVLALFTAVYAAGMSLVQIDARRFFAFLFLSHSSLVLAGLELANPIGMTGSLCVWVATSISLGGFGLTLRSVEARIGRISLDHYHGLFDHMPQLGALFLVTGLASIGFPGSLAFVGMELLVEGTVEVYPLVGMLVVSAAVMNSIAVLRAYFRIFTGTRHVATIPLAARPAERLVAITASLLVLGVGLWPGSAVRSRHHAADALLRLRQTTGIDEGMEATDEAGHSALDDWLRGADEASESPGRDRHEHEHEETHEGEHERGQRSESRDPRP